MINPVNGLLLSGVLFAAGAYGVLVRRNLLVVLMSLELMLNAVNLAFIALASARGGAAGQAAHVFVLISIAVAAAEAAVGLAFVLAIARRRRTADADPVGLGRPCAKTWWIESRSW
jgi:NADH-quinone oxidoreductase subunit K